MTVSPRLFLSESWTDDAPRMVYARWQLARTKPVIAIEEIDRVIASGARFGCVLVNASYGSSGPFRQALSERGLQWAAGMSRCQNVYPADTGLIFPEAATGRRRKYHIPDRTAVSAEKMLAAEKWKKISWQHGAKGKLTFKFAACRVRVADGHKHRMSDGRVQAMPSEEEVWLVGERRESGEQKYYLSNLPSDADLQTLASTIKARWLCEQEQEHQQRKEELGLAPSWTYHAQVCTGIAYNT